MLIQCDQIWISKLGLTSTLTSPVNNHLQVTKDWHEESYFRHVSMYIYNQHWWGPMGMGWHDFCKAGTAFDCCNFLWWRAEEGWSRHLSQIAPRSSLVPLNHPPNFSVPPAFNAGCVKSMMTSIVSKPYKMHCILLFWALLKNKSFHKPQNFKHFAVWLFPMWLLWTLTSWLFLSDQSSLDVFLLYGIYFQELSRNLIPLSFLLFYQSLLKLAKRFEAGDKLRGWLGEV